MEGKSLIVWSEKQDALIRKFWAEATTETIMEIAIGYSASTIKRRARVLGLSAHPRAKGGKPPTIRWTEEMNQQMVDLRSAGHSWDTVSAALGVSRNACITHAKRINRHSVQATPAVVKPAELVAAEKAAPAENWCREIDGSMPAGHPISWNAITANTCLEGTPYPTKYIGKL